MTLKVAIKSSFKDVGKGWYNLHESNMETYEFSKLRRFLTLVRCGGRELVGSGVLVCRGGGGEMGGGSGAGVPHQRPLCAASSKTLTRTLNSLWTRPLLLPLLPLGSTWRTRCGSLSRHRCKSSPST